MNQIHIGEYISLLRKKKNLTQAKLGEIIGVSDRTVSKWETGEGLPDVSVLASLASALDTTVDAILNAGPVPVSKLVKSIGTKEDISKVKLIVVAIISSISLYVALKILYGYLVLKQQIFSFIMYRMNGVIGMSNQESIDAFMGENGGQLIDMTVSVGIVLLLTGFSWLIYYYYKKEINKNNENEIGFNFFETIMKCLWTLPVVFVVTYEFLPRIPIVDLRSIIFIATFIFITFTVMQLRKLLGPDVKISNIFKKNS